jgi:hypothetical protein
MEGDPRISAVRKVLIAALFAVLTLSVSSWFFMSMGKFTDGSLCAPLDDSFIYFQYARGLAEGRGLSYSPGDGPTTGATSFLYTLMLALGYRLGATGDRLILFGFVLGSCFLFLSSLLLAKTVESFSNWIAGAGAGVLFLLNGHMLWSYLSGMEVGLFGSTMLLTLFLLQKEKSGGSFYGTSLAAAVMGWSRPEGFFLSIPVAAVVLVLSRSRSRGERTAVVAISLLGGLQFLLNFGLTGGFASTGTQAKSVFFAQEPDVFAAYMRRFLELPYFVLNVFLTNFNSLSFGPKWAWAAGFFLKTGLVLAGLGFSLVRRHRNPVALVLLSWVFLSLFLSLVPWAWDVHFHRYQAPFFPVFLILACAGFGMLAEEAGRKVGTVPVQERSGLGTSDGRPAAGPLRVPAVGARVAPTVLSVCSLCIVFGVAGVSFFGSAKRTARIYSHNCENIFHQQVRVGNWLESNTASDAIVGVNDAGAISYVGRRRTYDFVGITTPGQAINWRSGIGSVIEALESLPQEKLPDLLAVYPNWLPFLVSSRIARDEIFRAHLDLNTICGGSDKVVYVPDWSLLHSGGIPPRIPEIRGLGLVDEVDVADLTSESRHSYRVLGAWRSVANVLEESGGKTTLDGGRTVFNGEKMTVRCLPGKEMFIVGRLDDRSTGVNLSVRQTIVGAAVPVMEASKWSYAVARVPREMIRSDRLEVTARRGRGAGGSEKSYGSYHYWFLQ